MANPFDNLNTNGLQGLDGLDGLDGFIDKVKKTIRKAVKIVAPVVVGVVAGPAAGAAVAKTIIDHKKAKKEAKQQAKEAGITWTQAKKGVTPEQTTKLNAQRVAEMTNNPAAAQLAINAAKTVDNLSETQEAQMIRMRLLAQGYTPQQVDAMFYNSKPVQQVIGATTAASIYGGVRIAGYSPPEAAASARQAVMQLDQQDTMQKVLPYVAMGLPLMMMAMG